VRPFDELRRHAKGLEPWGGELAQLWEVADALVVELNRKSDEAVVVEVGKEGD